MAQPPHVPDVAAGDRPSARWHNWVAELLRREITGPLMMVDQFGIHQAEQVEAEEQARYITFSLDETLTRAMASVAATVEYYWGGYDPGTPLTVYNVESSDIGQHIFEGASGNWGHAIWNEDAQEYVIWQMECPEDPTTAIRYIMGVA